MKRRSRVAAGSSLLGFLALGQACTQLLSVGDIPDSSPDGTSTSHVDGGRDAKNDGTFDAAADADAAPRCATGSLRCAADGVSVESCGETGTWVVSSACSGTSPVCIGGACTCAPGATRCDGQRFQTCVLSDGGAPGWPDAGTDCPGTCTLSGCGGTPPSCDEPERILVDAGQDAGVSNCRGPDGGISSCCSSYEVPGGSFFLSYDGLTTGPPSYESKSNPATVSGFRLDRFEVTVGRFRAFVGAVAREAWTPPAGSGKHTHLNGGQGLVDVAAAEGGNAYEPGWDTAWNAELRHETTDVGSSCKTGDRSWTPYAGDNELDPINCVTWVAAYAFCIWDGGFLPSEAEWNYAAAGGSDQRLYPWSPPLTAQLEAGARPNETLDCSYSNYEACAGQLFRNVGGPDGGSHGDSRWLQADLAGNVIEWTLDVSYGGYASSCHDCVLLGPPARDAGATRMQRGGGFLSLPSDLLVSYRGYDSQNAGAFTSGIRCARTP